MKFLHISDLHIGKRVHEVSMLEDQRHILGQILSIAGERHTDGVLISGDVYDKSIPPAEGVTLFDEFLTGLHQLGQKVFIISGNHDSAERLDFGRQLMERSHIYICGSFQGTLQKVALRDEWGPLNVYLLPFLKPAWASQYYDGIESYQDAVAAVIRQAGIPLDERNVLLSHQFVTNGGLLPDTCESETVNVGGLDNVDCSVYQDFDYVALGHLHGPQRVGDNPDAIRYSGSPLKYSFSEAQQKKSVVLVDLAAKGSVSVELIPLTPLRDLRKIRGPIAALLNPANYQKADTNDYIHATLTDEEELYDAIGRLRAVYPNILRLEFDNSRTASSDGGRLAAEHLEEKGPLELFRDFYQAQNNVPMGEEQSALLSRLIKELGGERS